MPKLTLYRFVKDNITMQRLVKKTGLAVGPFQLENLKSFITNGPFLVARNKKESCPLLELSIVSSCCEKTDSLLSLKS